MVGPAGAGIGFGIGFIGNVGLQYFMNGGDWRDISLNEAVGAGVISAFIVGTGGMGGGLSGAVAAWMLRGTNSVLDHGGTAGSVITIGGLVGSSQKPSPGSWRDWVDTSGPYPTGPGAMCPR